MSTNSHMKVMGFALNLQKVSASAVATRVNAAAEILGLSSLLARFPRQLSGGQRQRVAMGRAIVRDPQVCLFDEPLSNLDAKLRVAMRGEIKDLHQRLKTTTVYVTHDQIEAMTMADKIVVLHDGHFEQVGAPLDLYDRPANLFVAGFIGSPAMNLLKGRITARPKPCFTTEGGMEMPLVSVLEANDGRAAHYGIRPEHLRLHPEGVPATVVVIDPTGAETHVVLKLDATDILAVLRDRVDLRPGEVVKLAPQPGTVHLFDVETGQRLTN